VTSAAAQYVVSHPQMLQNPIGLNFLPDPFSKSGFISVIANRLAKKIKKEENSMHCVNDNLQTVNPPQGWDEMLRHSFICHHCENIFKSQSDELYYLSEQDAVHHRHDKEFYRAFEILENGVIRIGAFDSVEENVIQAYKKVVSDQGHLNAEIADEDMKDSSKKFFDSMKRQKRKLENAIVEIRWT
jgi:hypothetical protein